MKMSEFRKLKDATELFRTALDLDNIHPEVDRDAWRQAKAVIRDIAAKNLENIEQSLRVEDDT